MKNFQPNFQQFKSIGYGVMVNIGDSQINELLASSGFDSPYPSSFLEFFLFFCVLMLLKGAGGACSGLPSLVYLLRAHGIAIGPIQLKAVWYNEEQMIRIQIRNSRI